MPASPFIRRNAFIVLLAAMLGELILAPVISALPGGLHLARGFAALVVLAALLVTGFGRVVVVLSLSIVAADATGFLIGGSSFPALAATLRLLFLSRVVFLVARHVVMERNVTFDTVAGAACAYLLLGVLWGDLYFLMEVLRPGSFAVLETWKTGPQRDLRVALHVFSMLNLATLGSNAVEPTTPGMGALCAAEALAGQLYLAVMIARLVGLHAARASTVTTR